MKSKEKLVSIIIRTKNEESWISSCLKSVENQSYKNFEIILVDNNSTDKTVDIAKNFNLKVIKIKKFKPGKAINLGIKNSKGEIIVCLSGHCIPVNENWLKNLVKDLNKKKVAGVYGRQEPLSFSSDLDKRDLFYTFGLDKKIQKNDTFFHNANSAFLRKIWKKFPFDEKISNIEDRLWGENVIKSGLKIVYEPKSSVYHYHGIHHDQSPERAKNVVRILEGLKTTSTKRKTLTDKNANVLTIIPIKGKTTFFKNTSLLEIAVKSVNLSNLKNDIILLTDNKDTAKMRHKFKKVSSLIRPVSLSSKFISDQELISYVVKEQEKNNKNYDLVVSIKETYPFREKDLINKMINSMLKNNYDTIIAAKYEERNIWKIATNTKAEISPDNFVPRDLKDHKNLVSLFGLCCITRAWTVKTGDIFKNKNVGIYEIKNSLSSIEVRDNSGVKLINQFNKL